MAAVELPGGPRPPRLTKGHWIAVALELGITVLLLVHQSVLGFILCLIYGYFFSAVRAGLEILKDDA